MKIYHNGLHTVYRSKASGSTPVRSFDQFSLLTEKTDMLGRADGIQADNYVNGGDMFLEQLFRSNWETGNVPQDFKDISKVNT